jgi:hypothetical protein
MSARERLSHPGTSTEFLVNALPGAPGHTDGLK